MIKILGFDWDEGNRSKCQKHGVSIAEIEAVLSNTLIVSPDFIHSQTEKRYLAIGRTKNKRPVYIVFTFREKERKRLVRPVSARYMHKAEIESYEKKANQAHTDSSNDNRRRS